MNKVIKWLRSPAATVVGFVIAAGLLLFSTVGGVRAALGDPSDYWSGQVSMKEIGVTLLENGEKVSYRDFEKAGEFNNGEFTAETGALLTTMLKDEGDTQLVPGKKYKEELSIQNTGDIDQYSRVTIRKYWKTKETDNSAKEKNTTVSPALIHVELDNLGSSWLLDKTATTPERVVLYYNKKLPAGSDPTPNFTKSLMIDGLVVTKVRQHTEGNKIITEYDYSGRTFVLEATVDAVQDHHAQDAIKSAWGVDVTISNNTLSLNN